MNVRCDGTGSFSPRHQANLRGTQQLARFVQHRTQDGFDLVALDTRVEITSRHPLNERNRRRQIRFLQGSPHR